ncbi:hypothetical protein JXB02_04795 [Candidatus Woesearchaeota archaeon]|nr:hypothetical protein [Candidatus Woesearchaeota archaeon]
MGVLQQCPDCGGTVKRIDTIRSLSIDYDVYLCGICGRRHVRVSRFKE